jgi:hypothetical protein
MITHKDLVGKMLDELEDNIGKAKGRLFSSWRKAVLGHFDENDHPSAKRGITIEKGKPPFLEFDKDESFFICVTSKEALAKKRRELAEE